MRGSPKIVKIPQGLLTPLCLCSRYSLSRQPPTKYDRGLFVRASLPLQHYQILGLPFWFPLCDNCERFVTVVTMAWARASRGGKVEAERDLLPS
jgi:hypothetical protein